MDIYSSICGQHAASFILFNIEVVMIFTHFNMTSINITQLVDNNIRYSFMAHKFFLRKDHILKDFIKLHVTSRKTYDMTLISM